MVGRISCRAAQSGGRSAIGLVVVVLLGGVFGAALNTRSASAEAVLQGPSLAEPNLSKRSRVGNDTLSWKVELDQFYDSRV